MAQYSTQKLLEGLEQSLLNEKIRQNNPFVYLSTRERRDAEQTAKRLIEANKSKLKAFAKYGTIYPEYTDMNPFHMHTQIPESETNYKHNWKMKLHDLLYYRAIFKRCPIGGLIMERERIFDPKSKSFSYKWFVARIQPELEGLQTFKEGEHWEDHCFRFTEQYHPQSLDYFWTKDLPKGRFIDEYGICNVTREKIKEALEHETYVRKFYYYLNFWELWGFRYDEFYMMDRDFEVKHAKKAERYIEKCLNEGKPQPFPYYDKSKDEYWKYRKPNTLELVLADRLADAARDRAIYYRQLSEFTTEPPFRHSPDLIETLAGDDWCSPKTLNRILATFPDLNKQIICPDAPEFKKRMQLVNDIIRIHPDYAPGHDGYSMEYYKAHPNSGIQEWAWRLGAIMNAFGPKDPMDAQTITTLLAIYINRNAIEDVLDLEGLDPNKSITDPSNALKAEFDQFYWPLNWYSEFDKKGIVNQASLTWYDVQFAAINSLLHCDNVQAFYGSQFAVKTSSIAYASAEDRDRYLKVMELNHKALYDDGNQLFHHRDQVRLANLKQIQEEFLSFKDASSLSHDERYNELYNQNFIFWNPMTVSYKTDKRLQRHPINDISEVEQERLDKDGNVVKEKIQTQSTFNYIEVSFRTRQNYFQQVGGYKQTTERCFDRIHKFSHTVLRPHFFISHSNVYAANPKYFDLTAATRPENNNSITIVFHNGPTTYLSGPEWQRRALLTIDFNDYSEKNIVSPVADSKFMEEMVPNANMKDIFAWIPELKARHIDFSISDIGLLTLYSNKEPDLHDKTTMTGNTNIIEFLERNPQILIDHYFTIPENYGIENSYHSSDKKYPGLFCIYAPSNIEDASYKALKNIGLKAKADPLQNGVSGLDPAFLELFKGYSYSNRPTMDEIRPVQQLALKHLEEAKHYNIFIEPEPEPTFISHDEILSDERAEKEDVSIVLSTDRYDGPDRNIIINDDIEMDIEQ